MRALQTIRVVAPVLCFVIAGSACERGPSPVALTGATRAVLVDPALVEVFGAESISTTSPEFAISFTPDGKTAYFGRASADRSDLRIMMATRQPDGWSVARTAPFSGTYRDVDPFVSPDGKRIYFTSDRPRRNSGKRSFSTWYVEKFGDVWSLPIDPGWPLNSDSTDVFVSVADDGTVVFGSDRDGGSRVYMSREIDGVFADPVAQVFGSVAHAANPLISPDGSFMLLVMEGRRWQNGGGPDLYVSCRTELKTWKRPAPLERVNSPFADFAPALHPLEAALFFTSERPGIVGVQPEGVRPPGDIYRAELDPTLIDCRQ